MNFLVSKKEYDELSKIWQEPKKHDKLTMLYDKRLGKREFSYLRSHFGQKSDKFDTQDTLGLFLRCVFLDANFGGFNRYIGNFKRDFFEFEIVSESENLIFFIEKSFLKYTINRICGGEGEIENRHSLAFLEEKVAYLLVKEISAKFNIKVRKIRLTKVGISSEKINILLNVKLDGFSMLCGFGFNEGSFDEKFKALYYDPTFNHTVKTRLLKTKIKCTLEAGFNVTIEQITAFKKDDVLFLNDGAIYLNAKNIPILKGKVRFDEI